jgi:hypothetical protein
VKYEPAPNENEKRARFVRARHLEPALPVTASSADSTAGEVVAVEGTAVVPPVRTTPLATLLTGHVLRDGELVLLALKPSLWFIVFQSILFSGAVVLLASITRYFIDRDGALHRLAYIEAAVFLIAGRVMWAVLHWMGRLYVLTDQRIIRLAGIFTVDLYDCPLRKVSRTQITHSIKEKLCRLGSIEVHPKEAPDGLPVGIWQTISKPIQVHEQIVAAMRRSHCG